VAGASLIRVHRGVGPQALVVAAAIAWGTVGVAGRFADRAGIGPVSTTAGRTVIAAVVLVPLVTLLGVPPLPTRRQAWWAGAVGLLLAAAQTSYFGAVRHIGVTVATLVALGLIPVLVSLAAPLVGDARIDTRTALAILLAIAGLALLVTGAGAAVAVGGDAVLGVCLAALCGTGFAGVNLLGRSLRAVAPLRLMAIAFVVGGVALAPLFGRDATAVTVAGAGWMAYIALVPTVLAYGLFFAGVARIPASQAAVTLLVEPVTAATLAAVVLDERLAARGWVGAVLVLAAIAVVGRPPRAVGTTAP
jgi:DME family drug/metabolite transporter